ncbi:MAG: ribonuclease H-like domain-containing protein, partial [Candidatus Aminicenantes bacterium]|nr:ribonuclease H-like domain-containing protein [Candidatus Aminicenantes bacterium]
LMENFHTIPGELYPWIPGTNKEAEDIRLDQALFFDTETTGLAGGSGTYIFLLGLGFFTKDSFCVRQYFMSDYHEEEALLWSVNQLFSQGFKLLVSYNGRCYDFPLMQSRFIMARLPMQLPDPHHLDLLFPTRRLWKRRLQDCTLSNIERRILNIHRESDIPGYLIPHVYFRYLQDRDARPLKSVFEHNLQDIVSLVFLTTKIGQVLQDPLQVGKYGIDLCSIGRIYEKNRDYEYSSRCYEEALNRDLSDEESLEVLRLSSFAYKKQGKWEQAEKAWKEIIGLSSEFIFYPYEELAKYYEHRLKDYSKAREIVENAMNRLQKGQFGLGIKNHLIQILMDRLNRIHRKQDVLNQRAVMQKKNQS